MKVTGFGDLLIHFSPVCGERFMQTDYMKMSFTGAEANVCAALAFWGIDTAFVTRVPENALAKRALSFIKGFGIDTDMCAYGGERIGVYYLENGASVRASKVIYDRNHSGFTQSDISHYDIDKILENTDILYLTGITCALSENLFETCSELCKKAYEKGVKVYFDVNYRPALGTPEMAGSILMKLSPYIHCLITNEEHLKMLTGISTNYGEDEPEKRLSDLTDNARSITGITKIAITVRRTLSASDSITYASYSDGKDFAVSNTYATHVVDRVGSGDAFSAGLIYGIISGMGVADAVEFGAASCAFKHTVHGDIGFAEISEIKEAIEKSNDVKR